MKKRIREIELSDAKAVQEIYGPHVVDKVTSFETELPDVPAFEGRIEKLKHQYPWLVFEADGKVLGYAYACSHRERPAYQWSVETSVYIHDTAHRCGVGRSLYRSLFEVLRRQGYVGIYAGITLPNPASLGLHESLGFKQIGVFSGIGFKFGQWRDVIWLQMRLSDTRQPVPKPCPVKDAIDAQVECLFDQNARTVSYGSSR
jgi:L-amino acid N-acyltransferase YncA